MAFVKYSERNDKHKQSLSHFLCEVIPDPTLFLQITFSQLCVPGADLWAVATGSPILGFSGTRLWGTWPKMRGKQGNEGLFGR